MPTPDGPAKLKLPASTKNGTTFRLRDKGMPALKGAGHGDLLVEVQVEIPSDLSSSQKKALEAFAGTLKDDNQPECAEFAARARKYLS